ncbi:hypothetical protein GQ44DRAFT_469887 [Phaeosphaeriaceae sp. PMI808]|nr:hypothetical protein GQ44DRAFT_469887 [Phaeosphaeriaceae sp. PMI808]
MTRKRSSSSIQASMPPPKRLCSDSPVKQESRPLSACRAGCCEEYIRSTLSTWHSNGIARRHPRHRLIGV